MNQLRLCLESFETEVRSNLNDSFTIRQIIASYVCRYKTEGITYPNHEIQSELLKDLYRTAGVSPDDVYYLEMHGTGTQVITVTMVAMKL